jgi:hypothetical protein
MRAFGAVLAIVLGGCVATSQQTAQQLGARYLGQKVDQLVVDFGPPASTFRMTSGENAYMWQLGNTTNIVMSEGSGSASTSYCRVKVISSPAGVVTDLKTEDVSGTGGLMGAMGVDIHGSLCARRLGISRTAL